MKKKFRKKTKKKGFQHGSLLVDTPTNLVILENFLNVRHSLRYLSKTHDKIWVFNMNKTYR